MANPQPMEHGRLPDQALADRLDRSIIGIPRNVVYWSAGILLLLVLLSMLQAILLPFVASLLLAYVLNPLVVGLARLGLSRSIAALLLLALFALLFVAALYFLVPLLATQIKSFAAALPATVDRILSLLRDAGILPQPAAGAPPQGYEELIGNVVKSSGASASAILSSLFSGGLALLNSLGLILITPIVTFYLLADWGKVVASAQRMIPRDALPFVEQIAEDINSVLSRFIRGQVLVCLILAVLYAVALSFTGVNYAVLLGIAAGLLTFIPFIGSLSCAAVAIAIAATQFWPDWGPIVAVAAVFAVGQLVDGNFLTPRLVGSRIGLHPAWLIFALIAFAYLFGFVGMLVAVPLSAVVGVVVRTLMAQYAESDFYQGSRADEAAGTPGGTM